MLRPALTFTLVATTICGALYPLVVTTAAFAFPAQAGGSLVRVQGQIVGSRLIAQRTEDPKRFWPRPSAASWAADASSGANLAPIALADARAERRVRFGPDATPDLLTASGSGLDPDLTPEGAFAQVPRVAAARGMPATALRDLVATHVQPRQFGILGEPRVNVLELNLALENILSDGH